LREGGPLGGRAPDFRPLGGSCQTEGASPPRQMEKTDFEGKKKKQVPHKQKKKEGG